MSNERKIYDDFVLSEDSQSDIINNHSMLIYHFGIFLLDFKDKTVRYERGLTVLQILVERTKIEGKSFPNVTDDLLVEFDESVPPIVEFINFLHRLFEIPSYQHEWVEFKKLLNHYKDK